MARVRGGGGGGTSGRGGGGGPPAAPADEPKLPRGMRETAALLRTNGYGVLNEEKLRHPHRAPEGAAGPSRPQQAPQQQQAQRQVRLVEPEAERRRPADKRKQREASASEDERPARSGGAARSTQLQSAPSQGLKRVRSSWKIRPLLVGASQRCWLNTQLQNCNRLICCSACLLPARLLPARLQPARLQARRTCCRTVYCCLLLQMRSCRCSWRATTPRCCTMTAASSTSGCSTASQVGAGTVVVACMSSAAGVGRERVLLLSVHTAHRAPAIKSSRASRLGCLQSLAPRLDTPCRPPHLPCCLPGAADPADGFPYPLVVQDRDLRTLLEIKPPGEGGVPGGELAAAVPAAAAAGGEGIIVPVVRLLPEAEQPDHLVREQEPPVVQRMQDVEQPDVVGASAAAQAASAAWRSAERAVALDPPYIRYVQVRRGW